MTAPRTLAELDALHGLLTVAAATRRQRAEATGLAMSPVQKQAAGVFVDAYPTLAAALRGVPSPVHKEPLDIMRCRACGAIWYIGGAIQSEFHLDGCWWPPVAVLRAGGA